MKNPTLSCFLKGLSITATIYTVVFSVAMVVSGVVDINESTLSVLYVLTDKMFPEDESDGTNDTK